MEFGFLPPRRRFDTTVRKPFFPAGPLRARSLLVATALAVLALVAWHGSFAAPFVFDDAPAVTANPSLRPPRSLAGVLWPAVDGGATVAGRPLLNLSFAANYAWGGLEVRGYHVVNLAIHVAAACLLFGVIRRTGPRPEFAGPVALATAALWLVHPLQTESVTYIAQRAESLGGFWLLLTLYGFVRAGAAPPGRGWAGLSVAACWLGVFTKETIVVAPLLVLLHDRTWVAGSFREAWRRRRGYYLALAASWLPLGLLVAAVGGRGGTAGFGSGITVWSYALTQCEAIGHYLLQAFWPAGLVFDYGTYTVAGLAAVWPQALLVTALVAGTGWALVRRPAWGYGGAVFLLLLAPSSSVVPVASQTIAEHRMYLALAIPLLLVVAGLWRALGARSVPLLLGLIVAATALTVRRNGVYGSEIALWRDTIEKRPGNSRAYHNLSLAELAQGNVPEADRLVRSAIALAPELPEPHYSLGLILTREGRIEEAMASYENAVRLDPRYAAAHNNLANVLLTAGRMEEAGRHYAEAVRLQPDFAVARNSYGNWLIENGRFAEGLAECQAAIRLQPTLAEAHFNAGNASIALGHPVEAEACYREALRQKPDYAEAYNNLGNVLLEQDRVEEALRNYREALRLAADYFEPRRSLAFVLLQLGRATEALPHLERLALQAPSDPEVARALAQARAQGR